MIFNNKGLTRGNLAKRRHVADPSCVFCGELENIQHLFFDCIIAAQTWKIIAETLDIPVPCCFDDLSVFWKRGKMLLLLTCSPLLPCGAYGCFEMNLYFRADLGET